MIYLFIAVFILLFFIVLLVIGIGSCIVLHKTGLLKSFLRDKWITSVLSGVFLIQFIICGTAMLLGVDWASVALRYTIYMWLAYTLLYGLQNILQLWLLLNSRQFTSLSQLMGRSRFFDLLIEKSIAWSSAPRHLSTVNTEDAHATTDGSFEQLLNDEALFTQLFPIALRRKMKRKLIGLVIHTLIFVGILFLLG